MKRVMREVFPTLCSPKNTNLNFLSGLENSVFVIFSVYFLVAVELLSKQVTKYCFLVVFCFVERQNE